MIRPATLLALTLAIAAPAWGQSLPANGVLQPPGRTPAPPQATPTTNPPTPAPRGAVQQVAPAVNATSALGHNTPGKPPPVIQPPANAHAQKAPAPPAITATAKPAAPKPPVKPGATPAAPAATIATAVPAKPAEAVPPPPAVTEKTPAPSIGSDTKQPLPRWASLRSDEVNLRAGPGTRYPTEWVYRRRDLPVQIEREFEAWRLIVDQDGVKGWVHSATLMGRRAFAVKAKDHTLRKSPADDATPVAILKPGVVGRIRSCEAGKQWCDVSTGDYRGWLKRDEIWGISANEAVN